MRMDQNHRSRTVLPRVENPRGERKRSTVRSLFVSSFSSLLFLAPPSPRALPFLSLSLSPPSSSLPSSVGRTLFSFFALHETNPSNRSTVKGKYDATIDHTLSSSPSLPSLFYRFWKSARRRFSFEEFLVAKIHPVLSSLFSRFRWTRLCRPT